MGGVENQKHEGATGQQHPLNQYGIAGAVTTHPKGGAIFVAVLLSSKADWPASWDGDSHVLILRGRSA